MKRYPSASPFGVVLLCFFAVVLAVLPESALAQRLYGYEDPLGMLHMSREKKNSNYVTLELDSGINNKYDYDSLLKALTKAGGVQKPKGPLTGFTNLPYTVKAGGPLPKIDGPWPHPGASKQLVETINQAAKRHKLDPKLVHAVIELESGFAGAAVSPKGAQGLMQLMPDTSKTLGCADPFDPKANIEAGSRYLRMQLDRFGDLSHALAAYNAGPENVAKYKGIPPFAETQAYVVWVATRFERLKIKELEPKSAPSKPTKSGKSNTVGKSGKAPDLGRIDKVEASPPPAKPAG